MSGTTYAFRVQAEGTEQVERSWRSMGSAAEAAQRALDGMPGAASAAAAALDRIIGNTARAGGETEKFSRTQAALIRQVDRLAAAHDAGEAVMQRTERLQRSLQQLSESDISLTDRQVRGILAEVAAIGQLTDGLQRAAQAQREAQAAQGQATANRFAGVSGPTAAEDYSARQADLEAWSRQIDATRASLVQGEGAWQRYRARLAEVKAANDAGVISDREALAARTQARQALDAHMASLPRVTGAQDAASASMVRMGTSARMTKDQVTQLTPQLNDLFVQVASGQGVLLPLIQQGPQITQIFGGLKATLASVVATIGPFNLAFAAAGLAVGAVALAFNGQQARMADLRSTLRGVEGDYAALAKTVDEAAQRVAKSGIGVSRAEATAAMVTLRQAAPDGSAFDFEAMTKQAADFARVMGTDLAAAAGRFARGMDDPVALVKELKDRNFPGMTAELRRTVEVMVAAGEKGDAFQLVLNRISERTNDAARDVAPLTEKVRGLRDAWNDFTGVVGPWVETGGKGLLDFFTGLANVVGSVASLFHQISTLRLNRIDVNAPGNTPVVTEGQAYSERASTFNRALADSESSGQMGRVNSLGYAGLYQYGTDRLADIRNPDGSRVYSQADGNAWRGSFNIAGFAGVRTREDFLANAQAQEAVRNLDTAQLMPVIERIMRENPDKVIAGVGLNPEGLLAVAHLGGERGMQRFVESGGSYNPGDRNGTRLLDYYGAFSRTAPAGQFGPARPVQGTGGTAAEPALPLPLPAPPSRGDRADAVMEGRTTRSQTMALRQASADTLTAALADPDLDQGSAKAKEYREALEALRAEMVGLQDPMDELRRRGVLQAEILRQQEGAARSLAEAEQAGREQARGQGKSDADQVLAGLEARQQAEARLADSMNQALATQRQGTSVTRAAAAAMLDGAAAAQEATIRRQAEIEALKYAEAGTTAYRARVEELVAAKREQKVADADLATSTLIAQQRDQISLLEAEGRLVGLNTEARQAELAVLKERQRVANAGGDPDSGTSLIAQENIRRMAELQRQNKLVENSVTAIRDLWSETGDVIRTAIVGNLATGEAKAISFGNVMRAVQAQFLGKAFELTVQNPLQNASDGGTRASIWSTPGSQAVLQRLDRLVSSGSSSTTGAAGTATPGSSSFSLGDVGSWGSGISKLWGQAKDWLGFGPARAGNIAAGDFSPGFVDVNGTRLAMGPVGTQSVSAAQSAASAAGNWDFSGVGMGMAVGSFVGGMVAGAKNPAKQQNAQIGSTIGAIVGAYFGPIGSMAGGAIGGAIGGLFGPKGQFNGATSRIGINSEGQFYYAGSQGKNADLNAASKETQAQIAEVNRQLKASGLILGGAATDLAAIQGFGDSSANAEPDLVRHIRNRGQTGNVVTNAVLRSSRAENLQDLFADVQWGKDVYEPLTRTGIAASEFQMSLAASLRTVDEAIKKARELGLAEDVLKQKRQEAQDAAYAARDREVQSIGLDLDARRLRATDSYAPSDQVRRFDVAAGREVEDLAKKLKGLGLEADLAGGKYALVVELERALAAERVKLLRDVARAEEDQARARANVLFNLDQDTLNSTGRGNTAARLSLTRQGEDAITALRRSLEDAGYGMETVAERVARAMANIGIASKRLEEDQRIALADLNGGLVDRYQTAIGTADDLANQLARLERRHAAERVQLSRQEGADLAQLEVTQAAERQAIRKSVNQAGQGLRAFLDGLRTTQAAGRSPTEAFEGASRQFERDRTLAGTGDAEAVQRITGTAQTLLDAASAMFGSSTRFTAVRDYVEASLANLPQTVAYDAEMVRLLREANAADLAQQTQLAIIAQRTGGAEGAAIVRAAIEAGYGSLAASLGTSLARTQAAVAAAVEVCTAAGTASVVASVLAAGNAAVANDNSRTAAVLAAIGGLQAVQSMAAELLSRLVVRADASANDASLTSQNTGTTVAAVREMHGVLAGGTNPLLSLIYDASTKIGQILAGGIDVRGNFGAGGTYAPYQPGTDQGGQSGGAGEGTSSAASGDGGAAGAGSSAGGTGNGGANGDSGDAYARGGVFVSGMPVRAFAAGSPFVNGVVTSPTFFPTADGRSNVMGEAGPEAIMPLGRDSAGRLGVRVADTPIGRGSAAPAPAAGQDNAALVGEVRALRGELAALRAERLAGDAASLRLQGRVVDATEATALGVDGMRDGLSRVRLRGVG